MIAAQPVSFFITVFRRASCRDRLVSKTVVIMSLSDSVHADARRTWSYRSEYQPSSSLRCPLPVALGTVPLNGVDHLAHRQNDPAQLHQLLTHPVGPLLDLAGQRVVVEQAVLKILDRVIHQLDSLEMAIHHDIEEAMQERPRTELEQLWVVLPALQL